MPIALRKSTFTISDTYHTLSGESNCASSQYQEQIQEEKANLRVTKATQKCNLKRETLDLGLDDTSTYKNALKALDFEKRYYSPDCSDKQDIDFSPEDINPSILLDF